jgi:hypothetical protein
MGMKSTRTLQLVVVASLLVVATAAGIALAFNRPHTTVSTVASLRSLPSASPSSSAVASPAGVDTALPVANLAGFVCGSSSLSGQASPTTAFIDAVRTGSHTGYDRFVVQFGNGQPSSILVRPQPNTSFINSPRGDMVSLAGMVGIDVLIRGADAHTSYAGPYSFKPNGPALVELRRLEDFEGQVQWGMGLARSSCYRSFILANPTRLVIDVQA